MDSSRTGLLVGYGFGLLIGALAMGVICGLIPLVVGRTIGQTKLGNIAFFCTVGAGLILGAVGALPTSIGFVVALFVKRRRTKTSVLSDSSEAQ